MSIRPICLQDVLDRVHAERERAKYEQTTAEVYQLRPETRPAPLQVEDVLDTTRRYPRTLGQAFQNTPENASPVEHYSVGFSVVNVLFACALGLIGAAALFTYLSK